MDQQLQLLRSESPLQQLVVYLARSRQDNQPTLEMVGSSPGIGSTLPPVKAELDLNVASMDRRWYPLQDGSVLLGVLKAEREPGATWSTQLDTRLRHGAALLTRAICLDLERAKVQNALKIQREQLQLLVHQLRNPLAALRTYAQLLRRRLDNGSREYSLVDNLLQEQERLDDYISAMSRIESDALALAMGMPTALLPPVSSHAPGCSFQELLGPLLERAEATASLQQRSWHPPQKWPAWTQCPRPAADAVLAEVVANLLENAFRYSATGALVGLRLLPDGICVWDSGIPIPESEREAIFQSGVRGSHSHDRPGSGLGLALARNLTRQLGGDLVLLLRPAEVADDLPKQGNGFRLILPAAIVVPTTTV